MQNTASFESIHGTPFSQTDGQVAVRTHTALIDVDVKRAIHRLQVVQLFVDLDRRVHILRVETEMPARLPQAGATDVRRIDKVVATFQMTILAVLLDKMAN